MITVKDQIIHEEGVRLHAYFCTMGIKTIGVGHSLVANPNFNGLSIPDTITYGMAMDIFDHDLSLTKKSLLEYLPFVNGLDPARRDALVNMAFQLGIKGLVKFTGTLAALKDHDYSKAADHMLDSLWAKQTPARAKRVASQIRAGVYYALS